jgi:isochorismate synthase EntC
MANGILRMNYKTQNKTWANPIIKSHKNHHEPGLITSQTPQKIQNTCTYLKFSPLTPSVEETVNLYGFKEVYKARNINVLFSQCRSQRNGGASHQKSK